MEKVIVNLKKKEDKSYEIIIGVDILKKIPSDLVKEKTAYSYVIISDSNVVPLYGEELLKSLIKSGLKAHLISFPAGEIHKNRDTKSRIEDEMSILKIGRDSCVIALGGGVVGDVAGFVAATYNRGISYIQVPTTLVASVDSSIGGKTGVDTLYGKNLIGAFYQPRRVYIAVNTLKTLHEKEIRVGLAEVIKYGVIKDEKLFEYLERNIDHIFSFNADALIHIIKRSCEIKGQVVELDEKESNLRKILNFGHTIGHAIENISDYKISHGEAISMGMVTEVKIALELGFWKLDEYERLVSLFKRTGLPTKLPDSLDLNRMIDIMKLDKKARQGKIEMVLPRKIGEMAEVNGSYGIKIKEGLIRRILGSN
ncbi:MAG TPA: 3-dehydroquinate synthase [Thermodesulfobacteriota bacterium]|nr:3-dehydroquinate synthase [Thermodesulfobacteriota bacterium]